jgi:type IX secretion system PorP/SprF family membrane protein
MNKRKSIVFVLLFFCYTGFSQNYPHYTQYIVNQYVINPALTGIENYTDVKAGYRHQWLNLTGGVPRATYLTIHGPIGKKDDNPSPTGFRKPGENPRGKAYWESYTAAEPHHGVGLTIQNMKAGFFNFFKAKATYAYHIGISNQTSLSAGVGAGISNVSIDAQSVKFNNPADPSLGNSSDVLRKLKPELDLGVYLYNPNYFIGISAMQVIPQKVKFVDSSGNYGDKLRMHTFLTAGYRFQLNDDISLTPSVMAKYVPNTPTSQFDVNVKAQYQDLLWLGASYRFQYGYTGMIGVNISNAINVGYSYDYTTTRLRNYSNGTHEVVFGFILGNRYGDWCPRNVW